MYSRIYGYRQPTFGTAASVVHASAPNETIAPTSAFMNPWCLWQGDSLMLSTMHDQFGSITGTFEVAEDLRVKIYGAMLRSVRKQQSGALLAI